MNKQMMKLLTTSTLVFLAILQTASAQYQGWRYSGSLYILTTPEGANLPTTASEEGFPLLVRLDKDWFDFKQAKANGEDIRFATSTGAPLAYQIDDWSVADGTAAIWVRIPKITGNARQEIKLFWGNADATSESNGKAVFNDSNGYLCVFHMEDPTKDEVGTLQAKDLGTTHASGMIGKARHFPGGKGIHCGDNITTFPTGNNPHSTELWFRDDKLGDRIFCWGGGEPRTMVQIMSGRPARVVADCYGPAGVRGSSSFAKLEWVQVVHTYEKGESRLFVNGCLDGIVTSKDSLMALKSPVKMYLGGWGGSYGFKGDIDEARVSKVARSANWVKMQYENQKPLQTVVGPLVQSGNEFSISEKHIDLLEGKYTTVAAKAGSARKVYWIIKNGRSETIADVDRFHFTLDSGRVSGDQSFTLQFKAVFADGVKTLDIPVTVREDIPDPVFTLQAPSTWDGREMIEIVPRIANLSTMQAKGAGTLKYGYTVSGLAVIKEIAPRKLLLKRAQNSGTMTVTATVSNGGKPTTQAIQIAVKEPAKDEWVQRLPDKDEKPVDNQFYARDDKNEGTLYYNGTLPSPPAPLPKGERGVEADSVFLKLYADDKLIKTESLKPNADKSYGFAVKLKPGLIIYKVAFGSKSGDVEKVLHTVGNLVCGDAYIIDGQSNAVGYNYENTAKRQDLTHTNSPWIRSFGGNGEAEGNPTTGGWGNAVVERLTPTSPDRIHFISVRGMALAKKLVADKKIPICILNGAVGGTRIDQHMPDPADHYGTTNDAHRIYRNLLRRVVAAKLTHGIRGVLWHQGEADQGLDGPDNCYGCETYQQYWIDLTAAWKQDYPNIRHYYLFQIWPNACSQGGTRNSDKLRDVQRRLSRLYSNLSVMPTLDIPSGAYCHFKTDDYEKMGLSMAPLLERDNYGNILDKPIAAPDLQKANYTSDRKDEIALEFDQPMAWNNALLSQFDLDGAKGGIVAGAASGNVITLKLAATNTAKTITYLVDRKWDPKNLLYGKNGIAALTFCEVPIETAKPHP